MANGQNLKVGLVFDDSLDKTDGVAQYVKTLGAWLSDRGHEVSYLVGETDLKTWNGGKVYSLSKNLSVKFNGNRLSMPINAYRGQINRIVELGDFDVIHVMLPYSPLMAGKVIKAAGPKTAVIGTFHIFPAGWASRFGSRLLAIWLGRSLKRFDQIVSVSSAAQDFAASHYGVDSSVVPNPVEINKYAGAAAKKTAGQTIVFLGRLVKRKGAEQLIRAFARLNGKLPGARLTIAGDGPDRLKLEKLVELLGVADSVEFKGFIDENDKPKLLASADIACFPSLYGESFGIVLIEAMAAGAGVVLGGDNPGYRSVLQNQPLSLVNPNDTDNFSARLNQLLSDSKLAKDLHRAQTNEVKQYDISVVGQKISNVYHQQIARRSKKGNN